MPHARPARRRLVLPAVALAALAACTGDAPTAPQLDPSAAAGTSQAAAANGRVVFWTAANVGPITVKVAGRSGTISYRFGSAPACGQANALTFTLAPGSYSYTASSSSGVKWSGQVTATSNGCLRKELSYTGSPGGGGSAAPAPAPAPAKHASLSIDQRNGNSYGWAVGYPSSSAADQRSLSECQRHGRPCQVVLRFTNGCGAYVVDRARGSTVYGWGTGPTRASAESNAWSAARQRGGTNLVTRVWGCN